MVARFPGGNRSRVTPVPIPNTEVKPATADGTARVTVWESRSLPGLFSKAASRKVRGLFFRKQGAIMIRGSVLACSAFAVVVTCTARLAGETQVRRQGPAQVPIEVSLKAGSAPYTAKGLGSCTHAPKASIYNIPAQLWTIRQE